MPLPHTSGRAHPGAKWSKNPGHLVTTRATLKKQSHNRRRKPSRKTLVHVVCSRCTVCTTASRPPATQRRAKILVTLSQPAQPSQNKATPENATPPENPCHLVTAPPQSAQPAPPLTAIGNATRPENPCHLVTPPPPVLPGFCASGLPRFPSPPPAH